MRIVYVARLLTWDATVVQAGLGSQPRQPIESTAIREKDHDHGGAGWTGPGRVDYYTKVRL